VGVIGDRRRFEHHEPKVVAYGEVVWVVRGLDVEAVCLQDVIPGNIDLLKMDCEGAEYEILESMAATGHLSKVRAAALEWHHYPGGEGLSDLLELLDGFSLQTLEYHDTGDSGILYAWR